jgi:hypothetical protein
MLGFRSDDGSSVTCVACGVSLDRSAAREYDKHGDRWERRDKTFEYFCKPCHSELCHQPRNGLESLLVECEAGECDREAFLRRFVDAAIEEPER